MGEGLVTCGIKIQAVNDISDEMCQFQIRQGNQNVIDGDIGDPRILAGLHAAHPHPTWLTAGFSCQPWSRLGDQGKSSDPRSGVLGKVLEAAFWLNSHGLLLECVEGAGKDSEVQALLTWFCKETKYRQVQTNLH